VGGGGWQFEDGEMQGLLQDWKEKLCNDNRLEWLLVHIMWTLTMHMWKMKKCIN
jgi:hypothetical protein